MNNKLDQPRRRGAAAEGRPAGGCTRAWTGATLALGIAVMLGASHGCGDDEQPIVPVVDLRADVNRDGIVDLTDPTEDADEESWDTSHGAIFLANRDDDDGSCPPLSPDLSDVELPTCYDAADTAIDGESDLADLARLKVAPWPDAPDDAVGEILLALPGAPKTDARTVVRLFRGDDTGAAAGFAVLEDADVLDAKALRRGVELALEGLDVVRDDTVWDGYLDATLQVTYQDGGEKVESDTVRLRLAPVLTSHHLQAPEVLYTSAVVDPDATLFRADLLAAA